MSFSIEDNKDEKQSMKVESFIFCWGKNKDGELSCGASPIIKIPQNPIGLKHIAIQNISSGYEHTGLVTKNGDFYICGSALHGKLGIKDLKVNNVKKFLLGPEFLDKNKAQQKVKQIACSDYHTLCLLENGEVYTWGGSLHKKLGQRSGQPSSVISLSQKKVIKVGCGEYHSAALTENGELYTWGGGGSFFNKGQLGHGHFNDIENPEKLKFFKNQRITQFSCGGFHMMVLTENNELYSWGQGIQGECGIGEFVDSNSPKLVNLNFLQGSGHQDHEQLFYEDDSQQAKIFIKYIACGGHHSLILTNKGKVYCCGNGQNGQLGIKSTQNQNKFVPIYGFQGKIITQIAAGWYHSILLTNQGHVYSCGCNNQGQLGLGDEESRTIFTFISSIGGYNINQIFAGGNHSWVVIDEVVPILDSYNPPSPLHSDSNDISYSNQQSLLEKGSIQVIPNYEKVLQLVYCEVEFSHRFIRFTMNEQKIQFLNITYEEYIKELIYQENGIIFKQLQKDSDVVDKNDKNIKVGNFKNSFTLMIISDLSKNNQEVIQEDLLTKHLEMKNITIGEMTLIKESDLQKDESEFKLGYWFLLFAQKFAGFIEKVKFFELRPQSMRL